ncbi:MAG: paraquat-inducible protein A [Sneathiella sp.]|nr:paraquat-inducible protein A [Sneathiella sp.]
MRVTTGKIENKSRLACPECDLLHEDMEISHGHSSYCRRCGAVLFRGQKNSLDKTLAFAISGLVFFGLANIFPILIFKMNGNMEANQLVDGALEFLNSGYWPLGVLVLFASVIAPFLVLCLLVSILLPLKFHHLPIFPEFQIRTLLTLRPWAMAEIFVIGIMVAFVKLRDFADVAIGGSLVGVICMVLAMVLAFMSLDRRKLWQRLDELRR